MDRIRVLIVSYYFPPAAGGGVQRVLAWAKYLPRYGVDVDVLAPDDPGWLQQGGLEPPPGVKVHRARNRSPRAVVPGQELARRRGLRRIVRRIALQPRRLLFPDIHIGWSIAAVPEGRRAVRERGIDVVLSSSPPKTTHVIAARVAARAGIPWVADYRDSWLDLPHLRLDKTAVRIRHALDVRYANRLMRRARTATTVSEPLAADLRRRHPWLDVHALPNGFDFEQETDLPEPPPLAGGVGRGERFVVSYTGNFFGRQSPQTFLRAVAQLLGRRPELTDRMVVRFIGQLKPADHRLIDGYPPLQRVVERLDFLPHREILAEQRAADVLFLYVAPGRGSQGVYTGKVFEYVAAQRPILALVPADNVCAELVQAAGTGTVIDPDDETGTAAALEAQIDDWLANGRPEPQVPREVLERISREHQVAALADLLRGVVTDTA